MHPKISTLQEILPLPTTNMPTPLKFVGRSGIRRRIVLSSAISGIVDGNNYSVSVDMFLSTTYFLPSAFVDICRRWIMTVGLDEQTATELKLPSAILLKQK